MVLRCAFVLVLFVVLPASARAQLHQPVGPFAVDVRGTFARHKLEPQIANDLGVVAGNMPTRSFGLSAGAHWYPWRTNKITLGIGGELLMAGGSRTLEAEEDGTEPAGPTVQRHFSAVSPQLSFNFGHRNGWSYISGGIGRARLFVDRTDAPVTDAPGRRTINYGAGARWFTNHHLAVSVDIRWYSVAPQLPTASGGVAQPRTTLMVLSAGIALR
jgi:hypothetical protein